MLSRRTSASALAALLTLSVAACGDPSRVDANRDIATPHPAPSINPTVNPEKSESPSPAASATASDAPSPSGSATGGGGGGGGGGDTVEATPANQFTPAELKVKLGTTVTWTNPAGGFHTVTGGTPAAKDTSKLNGPLNFKTYEYTFTEAGTYDYYCEPHAPAMAGKIIVS